LGRFAVTGHKRLRAADGSEFSGSPENSLWAICPANCCRLFLRAASGLPAKGTAERMPLFECPFRGIFFP
jgi:hypothetical protein